VTRAGLPGLPAQRTLLAWERTALGLLANAALLLSRTDPARLTPAAAALVLAVIAAVIGPRRCRQITQSPGDMVPEPSVEVLVLGTGVTILGLLAILL
jgi:putative membrane protein